MPEYLDPVRYLGNMANHQKMYDFERDILRVKNPLEEDFTFVYDQMPIVVPAHGTRDMERYLVRRYIWAMIDHIYQQINSEKMQKALTSFEKSNPDAIIDPYLVNEQIYLKLPRSDNPEFQQKVIQDCIVGLVAKHGSNRVAPKGPKNGQLDPNTPLYQTLIDGFKTVGVDEAPAISTQTPPVQTQSPINASQQLG